MMIPRRLQPPRLSTTTFLLLLILLLLLVLLILFLLFLLSLLLLSLLLLFKQYLRIAEEWNMHTFIPCRYREGKSNSLATRVTVNYVSWRKSVRLILSICINRFVTFVVVLHTNL